MDNTYSRTAFAGRVALVTGAGRGIGQATALALAQAGATLAVADLDSASAHATAETIRRNGGSATAHALDVTDSTACKALAATIAADLGAVSILVNNAGVLLRVPHDSPDAADAWHRTLDVNLNGTFNVTSAFSGQLKTTRGAIVNLSSIHSFVATGVSAAYSASKGAIAQYTKAMAGELAPFGVRVNAVAPGMIVTPMTAVTIANPASSAGFLRHVPLARTGEPAEIAGAVLFLASDAASYVTGVVLPVDGGYLTV
jgi:NAD(P)-dependent dehydrogenase (short-subunit alcohol dehydrogenase family)